MKLDACIDITLPLIMSFGFMLKVELLCKSHAESGKIASACHFVTEVYQELHFFDGDHQGRKGFLGTVGSRNLLVEVLSFNKPWVVAILM